ncbi:MAG: hypothetical protein KA521_10520 [Crocinitomicaceae bacterium]|nr:hypothetical protein [Crocinitomicaceae bacterium]
MEIEEIEKHLIAFVQNNILAEELTIQATDELKLVGLDSFSIVEIILFIERKFGFVIPDEQLLPDHFQSIQKIAILVKDYLNQ